MSSFVRFEKFERRPVFSVGCCWAVCVAVICEISAADEHHQIHLYSALTDGQKRFRRESEKENVVCALKFAGAKLNYYLIYSTFLRNNTSQMRQGEQNLKKAKQLLTVLKWNETNNRKLSRWTERESASRIFVLTLFYLLASRCWRDERRWRRPVLWYAASKLCEWVRDGIKWNIKCCQRTLYEFHYCLVRVRTIAVSSTSFDAHRLSPRFSTLGVSPCQVYKHHLPREREIYTQSDVS